MKLQLFELTHWDSIDIDSSFLFMRINNIYIETILNHYTFCCYSQRKFTQICIDIDE